MNRKITFIAAAITFSIAGAANASLTLTDALGGGHRLQTMGTRQS